MDHTDPKSPRQKPVPPAAPNRREARLAQALRANLRRRKQAGEPVTPAEE